MSDNQRCDCGAMTLATTASERHDRGLHGPDACIGRPTWAGLFGAAPEINLTGRDDEFLTKPPQRPHHWMNGDGTCHSGDMFEAGTPAIPLYTAEQMEAWMRAELKALAAEVERCAEIGMTHYDALGQDQLEWFRAHPLGSAFGDVADIPEGRDAVIAWLRGRITTPPGITDGQTDA